jgi:hypothetical protein
LNVVLLLIDGCWILFTSLLFWAFIITKNKVIENAKQCIYILNKMNFNHCSSIIVNLFFIWITMNEWMNESVWGHWLYHHRMSHNNVIEQPIDQNQWKDGSSDRIFDNTVEIPSEWTYSGLWIIFRCEYLSNNLQVRAITRINKSF